MFHKVLTDLGLNSIGGKTSIHLKVTVLIHIPFIFYTQNIVL